MGIFRIFALIGYLIFGIDRPILFAILTAFSTILPVIGTMVVWVLLGIGFFIGGEYLTGFIFLMYGTFVIEGLIMFDLCFKTIGRHSSPHNHIWCYTLFANVWLLGVIFGPLLLSYLVLLFNMYRHDYIPGSKAKPRVTMNLKTRTLPKYPLNMKKKKN